MTEISEEMHLDRLAVAKVVDQNRRPHRHVACKPIILAGAKAECRSFTAAGLAISE